MIKVVEAFDHEQWSRSRAILPDRSLEREVEVLLGYCEAAELGVAASLPPHTHSRGYEWSLDPERTATVTVDKANGPLHAAQIAN